MTRPARRRTTLTFLIRTGQAEWKILTIMYPLSITIVVPDSSFICRQGFRQGFDLVVQARNIRRNSWKIPKGR
jgi:hypothetical protein